MPLVILLKDVAKLGQRGDIKDVKDGFFRNYLLPNKLAELATKERIKKHQNEIVLREKNKKEIEGKNSKELDKLTDVCLVFNAKASEKGKLYESISKKEIADKLAEGGIATIPTDWIKLEKPLKEIGEFQIDIENSFAKKARVKVEIKPQ